MGSRSTTKTEIPQYLEDAGKLAIQQAQQIQQMGYMPYMGPEVAAVNPYEQAAAQGVGQMASAFGMAAPAGLDMGMPTVTQGGVTGYSSYPVYQAAMERLREQRPEQYEFFANQTGFDPITGAATNFMAAPIGQDAVVGGGAPVSGGGGNDDSLSHAEIMQMHYGNPAGPSGNLGPRDSSPRPVLRGQSTGGGLFSGLREAKNNVLDALGVI